MNSTSYYLCIPARETRLIQALFLKPNSNKMAEVMDLLSHAAGSDKNPKKQLENSNIVEDEIIEGITTIASDFSKASFDEINLYYKRKFEIYQFYLNQKDANTDSLCKLHFHLHDLDMRYKKRND